MIPALDANGQLPLGRYVCEMSEIHREFVLAYPQSVTRQKCFEDLQRTHALIEHIGPGLIEGYWIGGSFATSKVDPNDIDCLFILNEAIFTGLSSNTKRNKVRDIGKKNWVKNTYGYDVDAFVMVRERVQQPWFKAAVADPATFYTSIRGAWDDWWLRPSTSGGAQPSPDPTRGYLEVQF